MNILRVDFQELYERHLCRHSQFGLNVNHLATVWGTYVAVLGIVDWIFGTWWAWVVLAVPYLAVLAANIPWRVFAVTVIALLAIFALSFAMTLLYPLSTAAPYLLLIFYIILIPLCYKVQNWGHKIYTVERDMTEFNKKYPQGRTLFVILAIYELPILLHYLVFDRKNWSV